MHFVAYLVAFAYYLPVQYYDHCNHSSRMVVIDLKYEAVRVCVDTLSVTYTVSIRVRVDDFGNIHVCYRSLSDP